MRPIVKRGGGGVLGRLNNSIHWICVPKHWVHFLQGGGDILQMVLYFWLVAFSPHFAPCWMLCSLAPLSAQRESPAVPGSCLLCLIALTPLPWEKRILSSPSTNSRSIWMAPFTVCLFTIVTETPLKLTLRIRSRLKNKAHAYNPSYSETETRRITVWRQHGQIVRETLAQKYPSQKKGWWSGSGCKSWVQIPVLEKRRKEKEKKKDIMEHSGVRL
jgi:hypothetical protein